MDQVLAGEKLFFAADQLGDESGIEALKQEAQALGATVVDSPADATAIIVNPSAPSYSPPSEEEFFVASIPYHWIAACKAAKARVDPADLSPSIPFILNELDPEKKGLPLRIYVSVNIPRRANEGIDGPSAKAEVQAKLARAGALIVPKRKDADLMIVDKNSKFYKDVVQEVKRLNRTWQRFAEIKWVDDVLGGGKMLSITDGEGAATARRAEEEVSRRAQREDSFAAEEKIDRVGPGRPTGKPRNEYTPQDDEFLARYLAFYYPITKEDKRNNRKASRGSRKTYQIMVDRAELYPMAARHTPQSWHERYRKNELALERRSWRYQEDGIDEDLKTAEERQKERERASQHTQDEGDEDQQAESSAQGATTSPKGKERAIASAGRLPSSQRRSLVDLDVDDEIPAVQRSPKATQGTGLGRAARIAAASEEGSAPVADDAGPSTASANANPKAVERPPTPPPAVEKTAAKPTAASATEPIPPPAVVVDSVEVSAETANTADARPKSPVLQSGSKTSDEDEWYWDPPSKGWRRSNPEIRLQPYMTFRSTAELQTNEHVHYHEQDDIWLRKVVVETVEVVSSTSPNKSSLHPTKRTARKSTGGKSPRPPTSKDRQYPMRPPDPPAPIAPEDGTASSVPSLPATSTDSEATEEQADPSAHRVAEDQPVPPEQPPSKEAEPELETEPEAVAAPAVVIAEESPVANAQLESIAEASMVASGEPEPESERQPTPPREPLFLPSATPPMDHPAPAPVPSQWATPEPSQMPPPPPAQEQPSLPRPQRPRASEPLMASRILVSGIQQPRSEPRPSVKRKRPRPLTLAEEIENAARRTPSKRHHVDTVAATATVPPPRPRKSTSVAPPDTPAPPPPPPPLTRHEYEERVANGRELVQRKKEEYIRETKRLATMFAISPREVFEVIQQLRTGSGGTYWADCEVALRQRYGS